MYNTLYVSLVSLAARFQSARKLLPVSQKSTMTTPRLEPPAIRAPSQPPQVSPLTARPSAHGSVPDKVGGSSLALDTIFSEEPLSVSGATATTTTTATATRITSTSTCATVTASATATTTASKKCSAITNKKNDTTKQTNKKRKV